MNPEDVPAELVEKAYRARTAAQHGRPLDDAVWSAIRSRIEEAWIASALAAVLPDIQAQALREAADDLDLPGSTATGYYASEAVSGYNAAERDIEAWLVKRAARLTDTTEETTT